MSFLCLTCIAYFAETTEGGDNEVWHGIFQTLFLCWDVVDHNIAAVHNYLNIYYYLVTDGMNRSCLSSIKECLVVRVIGAIYSNKCRSREYVPVYVYNSFEIKLLCSGEMLAVVRGVVVIVVVCRSGSSLSHPVYFVAYPISYIGIWYDLSRFHRYPSHITKIGKIYPLAQSFPITLTPMPPNKNQ